jgi:hypothetical protein
MTLNPAGAIYSIEVEAPPSRPPDFQALSYLLADRLSEMRDREMARERDLALPDSPWEQETP